MKKYQLTVEFTFEATVEVNAETKTKAELEITNNLGFVRSNIGCTSDNIVDWNIPMHPDKTITKIKRVKS